MFSDEQLLSVLRKVKLPDMNIWVNLGDWPQQKSNVKNPAAVISWCGHKDFTDIVIPTYEIMQGVLKMMDTVSLDPLSFQAKSRRVKWGDKIDSGFFRGR